MLRRWEYYKIIWFYHLSRQRKEIRKLTFRDFGLTLETSGFESLYGGQFTLSTQLIKPNYLVFTTVSLLRVWFLDLTSKENPVQGDPTNHGEYTVYCCSFFHQSVHVVNVCFRALGTSIRFWLVKRSWILWSPFSMHDYCNTQLLVLHLEIAIVLKPF